MTFEELSQVAAVERGSLRTETDWHRYQREIGQLKGLYDGDSPGDPLVGYVAFQEGREVVRIDSVAIAPALQREGLGRGLLLSLQSDFPDRLMFVDVPSRRAGLIKFFARCGFRSLANLAQFRNGRNIARLCFDPSAEIEPQKFKVV